MSRLEEIRERLEQWEVGAHDDTDVRWLLAEVDRLRAALVPFASLSHRLPAELPNEPVPMWQDGPSVKDYRRAAEALK